MAPVLLINSTDLNADNLMKCLPGWTFLRFMESKITNQQFRSLDLPLAEPHFDEEATLLSARPVVPIERLTLNPGFSRPWVFGFALAGALLLGVSATAFYYTRFRTTQALPAANIETISSGAQGVASEAVAPAEVPSGATGAIVAGRSSIDSDTSTRVIAQQPAVSRTTQPLNSSSAVSNKPVHRSATAVIDQRSESEYETREERNGAKREARERKRANRERRVGSSSDQLLRIRDIFEGPQRP